MNKINCLVEECVYNCNNDCEANEIQVCSSNAGNVSHPDNTFCKTFSSKRSDK
ncbi:MAG: DUF1540 domain-containing protein [Clostridia bacterium]|jgi:hypothetical protein|nr:DUF1540 domain-containing protein [Clostridia bacterium]